MNAIKKEASPISHNELLDFYKSLAQDNANPNVDIARACPKERRREIIPLLYLMDDIQPNFERLNKPDSEKDLLRDKLLENSEFRFAREILRSIYDIDLKAGTFSTFFDGLEWLCVKSNWRDNFPAAIKFTYLDKFGNQKTMTLGNRSSDVVLDYDISFFNLPISAQIRKTVSPINTHLEHRPLEKVENLTLDETIDQIGKLVNFLSISGKEIIGMAFTRNHDGVLQLCGTVNDLINAPFDSGLNYSDRSLITQTQSELIKYLISSSAGGRQNDHKRVNALNQLLSDPESSLGALGKRIGESQKSLKFFMATGVSDIFLMGQVAVEPAHKNINRASKINMIRLHLEDKSQLNYVSNLLSKSFIHYPLQSLILELTKKFGEDFCKIHPELLKHISDMIPINSIYDEEANIKLSQQELRALNMPKTPSRPRPRYPDLKQYSMVTS